jgi:hypothetical protein
VVNPSQTEMLGMPPPSSLQILLVSTSKISTTRGKMLPPAHPPADLHGKSMETAANTAQKRGQPKGQPKQPSCKEEADQLAKIVRSNAWAKKEKKAKLKNARKQRGRLQGPLYPYSMCINGIEDNSSLTLTEWHGINADLVRWIAGKILATSDNDDLSNLNIEEYKFIKHPEK